MFASVAARADKRLISLIALIVRFIFFNRTLIAVLMHILSVFHLQVDIIC